MVGATKAMNASRAQILDRVRRALRTPAPEPSPPTRAPVFDPVTDPEQRFRDEFRALHGELVETVDQLKSFLATFTAIATDGTERVNTAVGRATASARTAELGVTGCDCLVAQTGSVIVSTRSAGGRSLSVLPPVHLVIADRSQLVPDLVVALGRLRQRYGSCWPSSLSVITGPSRTADIEKNLVLGAHGPKRLAVYWTG